MQSYWVPTGSMAPTIMPGDFIFSIPFSYRLWGSIFDFKRLKISFLRRGEVVLFRWPSDQNQIYIKRVIGLPGDHIIYSRKGLRVNGVKIAQGLLQSVYYQDGKGIWENLYELKEHLGGQNYQLFLRSIADNTESFDIIVPLHAYFVMGDNRDDSDDSRDWGCVPEGTQ